MKLSDQTSSKRLFLALWPDESIVRLINQHAIKYFSDCQGRILQKTNWHITLAFFGAANAETQMCIENQVGKVKAKSFELSLSKCGFWKKPRVAWLAPSVIPDELQKLALGIQQNLIACGYKTEDRDYQPHITLVRKAKQMPSITTIQSLPWLVSSFSLVESISEPEGIRYSVLKRWDF